MRPLPLRLCGSTGLCIDLLEGDFFSHEEKNEVNRPKVSVPPQTKGNKWDYSFFHGILKKCSVLMVCCLFP